MSFVWAWTQEIVHNAEMKQLHHNRLTQGSKEHIWFSGRGQARFPAWFFHIIHVFSMGLVVASQWVRHRSAAIAILEQHENREWRNGLVGTGLLHRDKELLQITPLRVLRCVTLKAILVLFYMMEYSSPFMGGPTPTMNRHTTTTCGGPHIFRVVTLSLWSVN
jgi:hypothetical protein